MAKPSDNIIHIGATLHYGDDWFREFVVGGVTFLAPLNQQEEARHALGRQLHPAATQDHGCSCKDPSCRYDKHYGNPLRTDAATPEGAQAPFGWFTEDHTTDKSATTYDPVVAERWRNKGWPVIPLYTHPARDAEDAAPRCQKCGYTYEDCLIHMDHRLCGEPTPGTKT